NDPLTRSPYPCRTTLSSLSLPYATCRLRHFGPCTPHANPAPRRARFLLGDLQRARLAPVSRRHAFRSGQSSLFGQGGHHSSSAFSGSPEDPRQAHPRDARLGVRSRGRPAALLPPLLHSFPPH